ncbi:MAG: AAA family ATPase [Planctomycetes bacterium]|nr:AAA family ATPase [Planctomycetota bacterium]
MSFPVDTKYTPERMSPEELSATFAARTDTLEYLLTALRDQSAAGSLTSFLITGPRGAGKTTLLLMLAQRIEGDPELRRAWLPVRLPEEQYGVTSLRDLFVAALRALAEAGIAGAEEALGDAETEVDEERSRDAALEALRRLSERLGRRLILLVENVDALLRRLDDLEVATLRRLLMTEPHLMVIATAIRMFPELTGYDRPFFNYFAPVPLGRLNEAQVHELLDRRARFDGNTAFRGACERHQGRIQALRFLTGGNPRLMLMVYELLSSEKIGSVVQALRRLVDELTPLLKHVLEDLPPQQAKIVDAIMRAGGTATPSDLAARTRLPLNKVTSQLARLKEAQLVDLLRGGKGQAAYYTIPDPLFCTWYRMRYLPEERRRIEILVRVIAVWFEEGEALAALRALAGGGAGAGGTAGPDRGLLAEHYAAALRGTAHAAQACDLAVQTWLRIGDLTEAAAALADLAPSGERGAGGKEADKLVELASWAFQRGNGEQAAEAVEAALRLDSGHGPARFLQAFLQARAGNAERWDAFLRRVLESQQPPTIRQGVHLLRGWCRKIGGDLPGAIADYTAALEIPRGDAKEAAKAQLGRAVAREALGDRLGALEDIAAVVSMPAAPVETLAEAVHTRAHWRLREHDLTGALADATAVVDLSQAPPNWVAGALACRGAAKRALGDWKGAFADLTAMTRTAGFSTSCSISGLELREKLRLEHPELADIPPALEEIPADTALDQRALAILLASRAQERDARGLSLESLQDWFRVLALPAEAPLIWASAACRVLLFAHGVMERRPEMTAKTLDTVLAAIAAAPAARRVELAMALVQATAIPPLRDAWRQLYERLAARPEPDLREALAPFQPVAAALASGEAGPLDALPPERRQFAREVLSRFEPASPRASGIAGGPAGDQARPEVSEPPPQRSGMPTRAPSS